MNMKKTALQFWLVGALRWWNLKPSCGWNESNDSERRNGRKWLSCRGPNSGSSGALLRHFDGGISVDAVFKCETAIVDGPITMDGNITIDGSINRKRSISFYGQALITRQNGSMNERLNEISDSLPDGGGTSEPTGSSDKFQRWWWHKKHHCVQKKWVKMSQNSMKKKLGRKTRWVDQTDRGKIRAGFFGGSRGAKSNCTPRNLHICWKRKLWKFKEVAGDGLCLFSSMAWAEREERTGPELRRWLAKKRRKTEGRMTTKELSTCLRSFVLKR
jgi:hypothetical protein